MTDENTDQTTDQTPPAADDVPAIDPVILLELSPEQIQQMTELGSTEAERAILNEADAEAKPDAAEPAAEAAQAEQPEAPPETNPEPNASAQADDAAIIPEQAPYQVPEGVLMGEELDAMVKDKQAEMTMAFQDFNNGEITEEQYQERQAALNDEIIAAKTEAAKHEALLEQQRNSTKSRFEAEATKYMAQYDAFQDPQSPVATAFAQQVNTLGADPRFANVSDRALLETAHRTLEAIAGVAGLEGVPAFGEPNAPKAEPKAQPEPEEKKLQTLPPQTRPQAPETLRDIPPAMPTGVNDGQFAGLDHMLMAPGTDPDQLARHVEAMSPAQLEAWLAAE